jgi:hypothetical protein
MLKLVILTLTHSSHVKTGGFEHGTHSIQAKTDNNSSHAETGNFDHETL